MLKIPLEQLRGQIQVHPETWNNPSYTTSYAYALGLDIEESKICKNAYVPGRISGSLGPLSSLSISEYFPYHKLERNFKRDLKALNISSKVVQPNAKIEKGDWKVAIFVSFYDDSRSYKKLYMYKFLRQNPDGVWMYKNGYFNEPTNLDSDGQIIEDPRECHIKNYKYHKCYCLSLKNWWKR